MIFDVEDRICLELLLLVLCDSWGDLHQLSILVKLEKFLVAIVSEASFYETLQDHLDLVHLVLVDNRVHFVSDVADILRTRSKPMTELEVLQALQGWLWIALVLLPLVKSSLEEFTLIQVLEEFLVVHEWVELGNKSLDFLRRLRVDIIERSIVDVHHLRGIA